MRFHQSHLYNIKVSFSNIVYRHFRNTKGNNTPSWQHLQKCNSICSL